MARFGLSGGSYQSQSPNVDAEYTANLYPEPVEANGRSALAMYPTPGLSLFGTLPSAKVQTGVTYAVPTLVQQAQGMATVGAGGTVVNLTANVAFANATVAGNFIIAVVRCYNISNLSNDIGMNGLGPITPGFDWLNGSVLPGSGFADQPTGAGNYTNGQVKVWYIPNCPQMVPTVVSSETITNPRGGTTGGAAVEVELYEFSGVTTTTNYNAVDSFTQQFFVGNNTATQVPQVNSAFCFSNFPNGLLFMATTDVGTNPIAGVGYTLGLAGVNVPGASQYLVQAAPGLVPVASFDGAAQGAYGCQFVAFKAAIVPTYQVAAVKSVVGMLSWENRLFAVANFEPIGDLAAWGLFEVFSDGTPSPTSSLAPGAGKNNGWGYFQPGQGGNLPQALASMAVMPTNPGQLAIATGGDLYVAKLDHSSIQKVVTSPGNLYRQVEYVDGFLVATLGNSIGSYKMSSIARLGNTVTAILNNPTGQAGQLTVDQEVNVQNVFLASSPTPKAPTVGSQFVVNGTYSETTPWTNPGNLTTPGAAPNVVLGPNYFNVGVTLASEELLGSAFGLAVPGGIPISSVTVYFTLWSDTAGLVVYVDLVQGGVVVNNVENGVKGFGGFITQVGAQVLSATFLTIDGTNSILPANLNDVTFGPGFNASGGPKFTGKLTNVSISNVVIVPTYGTQTQFNGLFSLTSVSSNPGDPPAQFTVTWTQAGEDNNATFPGTLGPLNQQGSNQFQISNLFDATNWLPINQAGIALMTDEVISMIVSQRLIWFFGRKKTIPYYNTGQLFPFSPIPGVFIEKGAGAQLATVRLDNSIFWIEADERGWATAQRGTGYTPTRISNHGLETRWASYSTVADAIGYSYAEAGHNFWVIYFPSANATDVYDVNTGQWCSRGLLNNAGGLDAHLGQCHAFCFGKNLVGDRKSGNIYVMSIANLTDNGQSIKRVRRSPAIAKEHEWLIHHKLEVLVETGLPSNLIGPAPFPPSIILADSLGQQWQVTITDAGVAVLTLVVGLTPNPPVVLNDDQTNTTCWQLEVSSGGGYGQGGFGQGPYGGGGTAILIGIAVPFRSNQQPQVFQMATTPGFLQTGIVFTNAGVPQIIAPSAYQVEPQLFLRWSDDGGHTWSNPQARGAGLTGQYGTRLIWRRLGRSRNRVYEISTTDPIPWRIIDGFVMADPGFAPTERLTDIYRKLG